MRQQYMVPRKSVKKLREMSRREGISAGEVARRAIEAYISGNVLTEPEEEVASRAVLKDIHAQVRAALTRIDARPFEQLYVVNVALRKKPYRCSAITIWCGVSKASLAAPNRNNDDLVRRPWVNQGLSVAATGQPRGRTTGSSKCEVLELWPPAL
jgi:hypothetical protein